MANFNTNLNNLFKNYQQQRQYANKNFDVNGDGKINSKDKTQLTNTEKNLLKNSKLFDVNLDGKFDQKDVDMFLKGDVNGDGKVTDEEKNFIKEYKDEFLKSFKSAKASFTMDNKKYVSGKLASGVVDGKYYKNGVLASGKVKGITYNDGVAMEIDKIPAEYKSIINIDFSTLRQSSAGECGPLSSIMALYATENGKKAINNAIKKDNQGNYIVTFKGKEGKVGNKDYNYIVTKEEIQKYRASKPANGSFAVADDAILAIEIANAKVDGVMDDNAMSKDSKYTGLVYDKEYKQTKLMQRLAGVSVMEGTDNRRLSKDIINAAKGNIAVVINIGNNFKTINCVGTPSKFKVTGGGHFIAVTGISADGKTVTLTDPVDGSKQYKVTIDELSKITSFYRYTREIK